jgi:hypothetical protein
MADMVGAWEQPEQQAAPMNAWEVEMASGSSVCLAGWKSSNGRAQYVAAYRRAQELWEVPAEDREIPIRFGTTHALVSGPADSPPVFLLHAAFQHWCNPVVPQCCPA